MLEGHSNRLDKADRSFCEKWTRRLGIGMRVVDEGQHFRVQAGPENGQHITLTPTMNEMAMMTADIDRLLAEAENTVDGTDCLLQQLVRAIHSDSGESEPWLMAVLLRDQVRARHRDRDKTAQSNTPTPNELQPIDS